jgi:hypothetical protein
MARLSLDGRWGRPAEGPPSAPGSGEVPKGSRRGRRPPPAGEINRPGGEISREWGRIGPQSTSVDLTNLNLVHWPVSLARGGDTIDS